MTAVNFDEVLKRVLVHEGGNDDDPRDPGGRTSRGITQYEWDVWRKAHPGLPADVWQAPQTSVHAIYRQKYWDAVQGDQLPPGVDYAVADYAINSGVSRAAKVLQRLVGVTVDGEIGPETLAAVRARDPKVLVGAIQDERLAFLKGLSTWPTFKNGWTRRVAEVRAVALAMAGRPQDVIPSPEPIPLPDRPPWLARMDAIMGLYEFPGGADNPAILGMAKACGGQIAKTYTHDSIPWCALTVNYVLIASGYPGNDSLWALDFAKYGRRLSGPTVGAIASQARAGGGHVYLVVGRTSENQIVARGGNQADMVNDTVFPAQDTTRTYTFPTSYPVPGNLGFANLPIVKPAPKAQRTVILPPPTPALTGKGAVPTPRAAPVAATAAAGGAVAAASWWEWVVAHPLEVGLIAAGLVMIVGTIVYFFRQRAKTQQDAPTPDQAVVAV